MSTYKLIKKLNKKINLSKTKTNCGGQTVARTIKVKLIGPVAHSRMQICPRRPRLDCKGNHMKGIVNITKGEFSIRPRTQSSSAT